MDEHQVRRWTSWRRWTLLAMIAHALLAVLAADEHTDRPAPTTPTGAPVPDRVSNNRDGASGRKNAPSAITASRQPKPWFCPTPTLIA